LVERRLPKPKVAGSRPVVRFSGTPYALVVRSLLVLRSPSDGTGWQEQWSFTGRDDTLLRECLAQLDEFRTTPPLERWDAKRGHVFDGDRWAAAMLLHPDEASPGDYGLLPPPAEAAWTERGALHLAGLLPDQFAELRRAISARFASQA
jgi:hypothetical protein